MNCCDITSAHLNRLITVEQVTRVTDELGGATDSWAQFIVTRAMVKPVSGRERFFASRIAPEVDTVFTIRFVGDANYVPTVTPAMRVKYKGEIYGIKAVIDLNDERRWLEIYATKGAAS